MSKDRLSQLPPEAYMLAGFPPPIEYWVEERQHRRAAEQRATEWEARARRLATVTGAAFRNT